LFPNVEVLHCPLPDQGGLNERELRLACGTAETLAEQHAERARKRAANLRYAAVRAADAAALADRAHRSRRAHASAEVEALRSALAQAHARPADRRPPGWSPEQRPFTAQLRDAARTAIVRTRRRPSTLEEHLVLGWAALRAAEGRRVLVACLQ